ncbi:hypothetical protein LguiA_023747 [Lonicera macranthoides]
MSLSHYIPNPLTLSLFLFLLITGTTSLPATSTTTIGVSYNPSPNLPPPDHVASHLQSLKITAVRLPQPSPALIRAFSYSNISLLLSVPNSAVPSFASNRSAAQLWLYNHVVPFYPRAQISAISVGTDILDTSSDLSDSLLSAIRNVHLSLRDLGIHKISVSTTFSFINIMTTAFPPSNAEFQEPVNELIIKPLLQFLAETNSSFLINLYPYNIYRLNSEIPIGYALFQEHAFNFRDDLITGVRYRNLFDMMVDAVIAAMAVSGHESIPLIVTETGWPSSGDAVDSSASEIYAQMYLKGLLSHLKSGLGTPLRKEGVVEAYVYELFDNDTKQGEQHWGILYPNMTMKYKVDFSGCEVISGGRILDRLFLAVAPSTAYPGAYGQEDLGLPSVIIMCSKRPSRQMATLKARAIWMPEFHKIYVDLCLEETLKGNRPGTYLTKAGWMTIEESFRKKTGVRYDRKQLKNHWDNTKEQWKIWCKLIGTSRMKWDPAAQKFGASEEDWAN